jgi:hypothetical protein
MLCAVVSALLLSAPGPASDTPPDAADSTPDAAPAHEHEHHHGAHTGQYGSWPMSREASGTAWQPDSSPMRGLHFGKGAWSFMAHGFVNAVYTDESGPRGDSVGFGTGMFMLMGRRGLRAGAVGFRLMTTAEPLMGAAGYPLLLQTGETADGRTPLVDRQHPHDMLMELAGTWSHTVAGDASAFVYLALAGEPPLGPPAFMHRASAEDDPFAPIAHHFLDATHVSHGVATIGFARDGLKFEIGAFNGHEPDQHRWNVEAPQLNSFAGRVTLNPGENWSIQASMAHLDSPEQLHVGLDMLRMTASVTYNRPLARGNWQTMLAWGRNKREVPPNAPTGVVTVVDPVTGTHVHYVNPGVLPSRLTVANAVLLESDLGFARWHTVYARLEYAGKDELFPPGDPRHSTVYDVTRGTIGYIFDLPLAAPFRMGFGLSGSLMSLPGSLREAYGGTHPGAVAAFLRVRLGP